MITRIGHPNNIRVYDANSLEIDGARHGCFTKEYIAGGSRDRLQKSYRTTMMAVPEAVDIIKQDCGGLTVAHSETPPFVDRDIKPQNNLIGFDALGLRQGWRALGTAASAIVRGRRKSLETLDLVNADGHPMTYSYSRIG